MNIGYARVSTGEQTLDLQPVLAEVLAYLREGDTLVVWRLDRLGRSLRHLIATIAALRERGSASGA
jgi:DNA invertase Pin-like site-specific DNA recombinase